MLVETIRVLRAAMGNRLSRSIIRLGMGFCKRSGKRRMENALAMASGESIHCCLSCRSYSLLIKSLLRLGGMAFGVDYGDLANYIRDPIVRRGLSSVLMGIGKFGITKPQLLNAPFLVVWNFTNACNLKCKHCYQSARARSPDELGLEEKLRLIDELAEAGVVSIAFSGGEPLLSPDFFETARRASERGMFVALATNGTLITREVAKKLKGSGVGYVEISLDSATPKAHDGFRGVEGAFERAIQAVAHCAEEGIFTCVATTVTKMNLQEVPRLIELSKELGAKRFMAFNFIPTGRGRDIVGMDLSPEEREGLLRALYEESNKGIQVLSTAPQYARVCLEASHGLLISPTHFYIGHAEWDLGILAEFIGGCGAGRLYCAIQPNGDVTPCVFMPSLVVGNIRDRGFLEIWHGSDAMNRMRRRDLLSGNCGQCPYKFICGGCRARALAYFEDFMAPDPGCIRNEEYYLLLLRGAAPRAMSA
ncbi:MAG: radical SAM protein [Candidatus Bathyarchaeia archaeon]